MQILVNGDTKQFESDISLAQLIAQLELEDKRIAVEINQELVPRSEHSGYQLHEGDKVEIVQAIGGG